MRWYRWIGALLAFLGVLWLLDLALHLDPVRMGLAVLLLGGGYWLTRGGGAALAATVDLMDREYRLEPIDLACAVADVKIDLARAIIPEGEHTIRIRGLVGSVSIFVPYDLAVSVQTGAQSSPSESLGYRDAATKVKIVASLWAGDVTVRCL